MPGTYSSVKPTKHTQAMLSAWMAENNIPNPIPGDKLHCTIVSSKEEFGGYDPRQEITVVKPEWDNPDIYGYSHIGYWFQRLGKDNKTIALCFDSPELRQQQWCAFDAGAEWNTLPNGNLFPLHVSLTYDAPKDFDITKLKPPIFEMVFESEIVEPKVDNWAESNGLIKFNMVCEITKSDDDKQMIYGFANVIEKDGEPVVDLQGDVISEDELVKAAHEFMRSYRDGHEMHEGVSKGEIVESIVFTKDVQKSLGINLNVVGWFIGYHVQDEATWNQVKKGTLRAFSIGGYASRHPIEEE